MFLILDCMMLISKLNLFNVTAKFEQPLILLKYLSNNTLSIYLPIYLFIYYLSIYFPISIYPCRCANVCKKFAQIQRYGDYDKWQVSRRSNKKKVKKDHFRNLIIFTEKILLKFKFVNFKNKHFFFQNSIFYISRALSYSCIYSKILP